ncbi:hypothetical protein SpCBS45565_g03052 [Spizellomyces sp. 'palustris']|nr:hypothetical protein SpCBS45565_g03052 [Spizellomyces sp. 'palustris']
MGYVLKPVFEQNDPLFVFALASTLILISTVEIVYNKSKHRHDYMFATVLAAMLFSVTLTSFIGNAFAIQADPWWLPRTYIPTLGMLLGNSMSGMALGLSSVLGQAADDKDRIELYLSFGASRWEAARPVCAEAIKTALLPVLNNMSVMGLISIPGMMTGQILGGAKIADAVRYQQIIMFMISASCAIATVMAVLSCAFIIFDDHSRLRMDRILKDAKKSKTGTSFWTNMMKRFKGRNQVDHANGQNGPEAEALLR